MTSLSQVKTFRLRLFLGIDRVPKRCRKNGPYSSIFGGRGTILVTIFGLGAPQVTKKSPPDPTGADWKNQVSPQGDFKRQMTGKPGVPF